MATKNVTEAPPRLVLVGVIGTVLGFSPYRPSLVQQRQFNNVSFYFSVPALLPVLSVAVLFPPRPHHVDRPLRGSTVTSALVGGGSVVGTVLGSVRLAGTSTTGGLHVRSREKHGERTSI